ncbi:hypothetical protein WR25_23825 [Diploscapter pachys]|uniref:Uncharacterized protein n=1 Tax=Diploscapter pachys TaxID=2018661 RepID=A0A2A2J8I1_9BILA|nr:hypothetical protein WR25_23825 [Diploscapter pachys]
MVAGGLMDPSYQDFSFGPTCQKWIGCGSTSATAMFILQQNSTGYITCTSIPYNYTDTIDWDNGASVYEQTSAYACQ